MPCIPIPPLPIPDLPDGFTLSLPFPEVNIEIPFPCCKLPPLFSLHISNPLPPLTVNPAFIQTIKPTQIDGTEDKEIVIKAGSTEYRFKGMQFLLGWAHPNFYFHVVTAYDILRHCGVELGKADYLGKP